MLKSTRVLLAAVSAASLLGTTAQAQNADSMTTVKAEEVLVRVRRYTSSDIVSARALVDSLVITLPAGAAVMPEALFAKASIAPSAAEAERDYRRIVNEFKFANRVPDALMRLALLESARNNRYGALQHLDRLLRDHGTSPVRSRASLMAGRLRMESGDMARGCELLAAAFASAGPNERDVRDQSETMGAKCPTAIAVMAQREPPPMGILRAGKEVVASAPTVAPAAGGRRPARRDTVVAAKPVTPTPVRRDTVVAAKPVVPVIVAPVVKRDTAPTPKPVVAPPAVVHRDTSPTPVVAPPVVVKRDSAPATKPAVTAPVVVKRDTAPTPKPVVAAPVVRRDTAPTPKPVAPVTVVKRDTAPTPKPVVAAPVVLKRDTAPTPKPVAPPVVTPTTTPKPAAPVAAPQTAPTGTGRFGIQFAAYNDKPGAEQFASVLRGKGIAARVEGVVAPFRVRAGRYTTWAEAEAAAALYRRPGQAAIVVTLAPAATPP